MKLLTKELKESLPRMMSQDGLGDEAIVHAKFFTPWANWTWYVLEYDSEYNVCFGFVDGDFPELGDFSVEELESIEGPFGLKVERDLHFTPKTLGEVKKRAGLIA